MAKKKASKPLDRKQMKDTKGGLASNGDLQVLMEQSSNKTAQTNSNILKKLSDSSLSVTQNLK